MTQRTVKVLHVEDDTLQHRVIKHHLAGDEQWSFDITAVENEDDAIAQFTGGKFELVILDYQLPQGNGLSCLKRLRAKDPILPVVVVSGAAGPQEFSELLFFGAADCLNKKDLDRPALLASVHSAVTCADEWRRRAPPEESTVDPQIEQLLDALGQAYLQHLPAAFFEDWDRFESSAASLSPQQLQRLFDGMCSRLAAGSDRAAVTHKLRPILLESIMRLYGTAAPEGD